MRDDELLRYSRQIVLPEIDIEGQRSINKTRAIVIGLGGLGTVVSAYLARMGVGNITVCDYDNIDISNLHRQVLFDSKDIGCLLYTSPSPRDKRQSRMPSSA